MDSQPSTSGTINIGLIGKELQKPAEKVFKKSWLEIKEFKGWLVAHPDNKKAFCAACKKVLACGKSELLKHATRQSHKVNMKKFDNKNPSTSLLTVDHNYNMDHINKVKAAEIKLTTFFAKHNVALQLVDHMVPLIKSICSDPQVVQDLTLSRKKCTQIIKNVIGKRETEKTIKNLKCQKFSILLDESTTIANDKILCILVKYVSPDDKKCITELLELVQLDAKDCSAEKLYSAFEHCLQSKEIPLSNIVGMACDNASVMIGIQNSFVSRLKKEVPALITLKCICHSSALIASKACSKLPASCENLLHAVATYISCSPKRSSNLCEFQEFFGVESRKILKLSDTRWLILQKCVARLLENWEVLKHYFLIETMESKNKTAESIFNSFNDNKIKAYLLFLKYSLNYFNEFNALFQSRKILIHKLSETSEQLIRQMGQNFLLPDVLNNISLECLESQNCLPLNKIYLGSECETFLKNETSIFVETIKLKCLDFYITALQEMLKRLPYNDIIIQNLKFLDSQVALYYEGRNIIADLSDIAAYFNFCDNTALDFEWRILPTIFNEKEKINLSKLEIDEMWNKIFESKNCNDEPLFPNLEKLVYALLSLPHSNAEAERIFSIVTDVKNKKRNRMNIETLNAICKIRSTFQAKNIDCCNFDVDSRHLELHNYKNLYFSSTSDIDAMDTDK